METLVPIVSPISQIDLKPIDSYGFAGIGICLLVYMIYQHRMVMERVAPMLEKTALVLERVAVILDDIDKSKK